MYSVGNFKNLLALFAGDQKSSFKALYTAFQSIKSNESFSNEFFKTQT